MPKNIFIILVSVLLTLVCATMLDSSYHNYNNKHRVYAQKTGDLPRLVATDGIASGDVTDHSAVIWSRANKEAQIRIQYDTSPFFSHPKTAGVIATNKTTDFTGHVKIDRLKPNTAYYYKVWFSSIKNPTISSNSIMGTFRTAPDHSTSKPVRFIVGGDLAGQRYCRRIDLGYPIFSVMKSLSPDFFIFNGDQIYGDNDCSAKGPDNVTGWHNIPGSFPGSTDSDVNWANTSLLQDVYNKHWEYNRADPHLQSFLQNTSMYSQADDHEVANNYGNWSYYNQANKDRPGSFHNVVKAAINAFFNYSPIDRNQTNPYRIYRSFQWGKDMDLFILDAHSYRSRNDLPDTYSNKTLFGKEQLHWLEASLLNSNATWKVISDDDPVTIPDCEKEGAHVPQGCDNWSTNGKNNWSFSKERDGFLKFLVDNNIKNVVFVTTDVHYPATVLIEGAPLHGSNSSGVRHNSLTFYEFVSGPLSAIPTIPHPADPTINATYLYKEAKIFNFGYYNLQRESDGKVHFLAEVRDIEGIIRPGSHFDLTPK